LNTSTLLVPGLVCACLPLCCVLCLVVARLLRLLPIVWSPPSLWFLVPFSPIRSGPSAACSRCCFASWLQPITLGVTPAARTAWHGVHGVCMCPLCAADLSCAGFAPVHVTSRRPPTHPSFKGHWHFQLGALVYVGSWLRNASHVVSASTRCSRCCYLTQNTHWLTACCRPCCCPAAVLLGSWLGYG
jgi:hypothetical protein